MQEESQIHQNQPTPATSFKLKNFIQLITSVNPKNRFCIGFVSQLVNKWCQFDCSAINKKLVDTSGTPTFSSNMVIVLIVAFALQLGLGTIGGFLFTIRRRKCRQNIARKTLDSPIAFTCRLFRFTQIRRKQFEACQ